MSRNKMSSFYLQKKKVLQVENKKGKKKQGESTKEKHSLIYMEKKKASKEVEHIMSRMNWQTLWLHLFCGNNDDTTKNSQLMLKYLVIF